MTPIQEDGADKNLSIEDATEALLSKWSVEDPDAKKPSEKVQPDEDDTEEDSSTEDATEEDAEELSEDDAEEDEQESEEEETEDDDRPKRSLDDDAVVKIKVDGEEIEAKVKDLKRLYGQEAALTKKSQAVSTKLKEAEETGARYVAALGSLLDRAKERAEPYARIDWLVASKNLTDDELVALRSEAQKAYDDVNFFNQELEAFMGQAQSHRQSILMEQAKETVQVLKRDIPGWNEKVYDDIRNFAVESGMDRNVINNLVDPVAIKMLHSAMLYNKGKKAATTKINKSPKKLVKSTTSAEVTKKVISNKGSDDASAKLRKTGSIDDAAEAFLARWAADD
jgi:hypothetical protein